MLIASRTSLWESGLLAALIAAVVTLAGFWWNTRATRLDRQRQLYAEAFGTVVEYREYPFIVRRRTSESDRDEISNGLSEIQAKLNKYVALLRVESVLVGAYYQDLVRQTRAVAGPAIAAGWDMPVRREDEQMHVQDVDLSSLVEVDEAFIKAVRQDLDALPSWAHRRIDLPTSHQKGRISEQSGRQTGS